MNHSILRAFVLFFLILIISIPGISQTDMPDILKQGSLREQLNYIEERTRIYEYYRAIREDMFQQLKRNTLDTLMASDVEMADLKTAKISLNQKIDSVNRLVSETRAKMDEAVKTKNNISVLGININKFIYNSVMWIIVASLAAILTIGFLIFKRNLAITKNTKKDLEDLKNEFEAYRKQSREAREKMSMDHFNEIRRLRGKGREQRAQSAGLWADVSSGAYSTPEFFSKEVAKEEGEEPGAGSGEPEAQSSELRAQSSGDRLKSETTDQAEDEPDETKSTEAIADRTEIKVKDTDLEEKSEGSDTADGIKKPRKKRGKRQEQSGQGSLEV